MSDTNSNELEAQLRALAQAHKPDAAFAEQLEQRLLAAHGAAKPSWWSRVFKEFRLAEAPAESELPHEVVGVLKPKPNWSLASLLLLAVLVLAGGLLFTLSGFRARDTDGSPINNSLGGPRGTLVLLTKQPTTRPTVAPTPSAMTLTGELFWPTEVFTVVWPTTKTAVTNPIKLHDFHLSTTEAAPGQHVTATWSFEGAASKVAILIPQPGETGEYLYSSSPITRQTASLMFTMPAYWGQTQEVQLSVNENVIASVQLNKAPAKCNTPWFFTPRPESCPASPITQTFAAVQVFEGGRMFWFQNSKTIVVLYENQGYSDGVQTFADNYVDGTPEADPNVIAPAGKQQPRRGFGWVWRTYPDVRQRLGWALQPEQGFNTCMAMTNESSGFNNTYFANNTGHLIQMMSSGSYGSYYSWASPVVQKMQCSP